MIGLTVGLGEVVDDQFGPVVNLFNVPENKSLAGLVVLYAICGIVIRHQLELLNPALIIRRKCYGC